METLYCPGCRWTLPADGVDRDKLVATCARCGSTHEIDECISEDERSMCVAMPPPKGCIAILEPGRTTVVVYCWSPLMAILRLVFGLAFVVSAAAVGGEGLRLVFERVTGKGWPPLFGVELVESWGSGEKIFATVFMMPFALAGISCVISAVAQLAGRVTISISDEEVHVFGGLWRTGKPRSAARRDIVAVSGYKTHPRRLDDDGLPLRTTGVFLKGGPRIPLTTFLPPGRRTWLVAMLKMLLSPRVPEDQIAPVGVYETEQAQGQRRAND